LAARGTPTVYAAWYVVVGVTGVLVTGEGRPEPLRSRVSSLTTARFPLRLSPVPKKF
jgi:hypothetical protein